MFFALAVSHALADFPLQGGYIAKQKNPATADSRSEMVVALGAHALIHAGAVWLVTGSQTLGCAELVLHALIDLAKGRGKFGFLTDQALHLLCKVLYAVLLAGSLRSLL
jgi:hypothetical protein